MGSYFLLLFLGLYGLFVIAYAENIDCGSSEYSYTDENSVVWSGDDRFIENGDSETVQTRYSVSEAMDTLRVFTTRKKNCYSISNDLGGLILVRASFLYGNYDNKSSPPTFSLQFDGNDWVTVKSSIDQVVQHELIFHTKGDYSSVCVAQTNPNQFPFISALEVHSLASDMYQYFDANHALFLHKRVAYGADLVIGYSDDQYGRLWAPAKGGNGLTNVTNDAVFIENAGIDNPPESVLKNAVMASNTSQSIKLVTDFPSNEVIIYMNLYFSEVTELGASENRSFILYKDGEAYSDTIVPPYGGFVEYTVYNLTVSSNTTFSLVPTANSTLPPIINALEVFFFSDVLTVGTNSKDVKGLLSLQESFSVLADWVSDPCLPAPYSWEWINCTSDPIPRVTELHLRSFSLSGEIPDFSSMDALEIIDLNNNSLYGAIPDYLGQLPNLKQLNLAKNEFSGSIPSSLSTKNGLLDVTDNPYLCTTSESCETTTYSPNSPTLRGKSAGRKKKKSNKLPVILGTTIPILFLVWVIAAIFAVIPYYKKRAAMAAANTGQHGGGTTPLNGTNANSQMPGKDGKDFTNEIKYNTNMQVEIELDEHIHNQHTTVP